MRQPCLSTHEVLCDLPKWIQVSIHLTIAAAVLAGLLVAAPFAPAMAAGAATSVRVRIGVTSDGIVQVTGADLAAAGVDLATVDPRTFAVTSLGASVAIDVSNEANGVFGPADRILFFGQKFRGTQFQEKYTDERVYWLDIGGAAGPRITNLDATPQGNLQAPNDIAATVHAEIEHELDPAMDYSACERHSRYLVLAQAPAPHRQPDHSHGKLHRT